MGYYTADGRYIDDVAPSDPPHTGPGGTVNMGTTPPDYLWGGPKNSGGGGGGGGAGAPAATVTTGSAGDFASDSLKLGADGHIWGEKRVISADPNSPGNTRYQFTMVDLGDSTTPDGLAAISAASGIPVGALTAALPGLEATRAQQQRGTNGSVIGANADGTITYYDRGGNIQSTADMGVLGAAGIQQADILQAQTDYQQRARTMANTKQYSAVSANPDGSIAVKDFDGNITNVPAATASTMPGISAGDVQQLVQQGNERNFQNQTVGQTLGFALPGGAQPAPAASAAPPPRAAAAPAPAATPNYLPTPPAAAAPAPSPTPSPAPSPTSSYPTPPAAMATAPPAGGVQTRPGAPTPATGPTPGMAPPPGPQTSGTATPAGGGTSASGPNLQAQYQAAAAAYTANSDPNAWTNQQLSLTNQARQNYLNYGKAAQSQQTAAIAGQSRDASGTGFSSIDQRQTLAGQ